MPSYRRRRRRKPAAKASIVGVVLVGAGTMTALGSGVSVLAVAGALGLGYLLIRNRRKISQPLTEWAKARRADRPHGPDVFTGRIPSELRARIPSNADDQTISLDEYRRRRCEPREEA